MKHRLFTLIAAAALAVPLTAGPITFSANLNGPSEEPANGSPGIGTAIVTMDAVAHTLEVQVEFSGLIGNTTASHIHVINGPGDSNTGDTVGPVATMVPYFPGFPIGVTAGSYGPNIFDTLSASTYRSGFITAAGSLGAAEAALFDGLQSGRAYLNVHSNVFTGGEIRGFLNPVPEPATVGMTAIALAGLAALHRRRKNRQS